MLGALLGLALTSCLGLDDVPASPVAWSPDGRWAAYVDRESAHASIPSSADVWGDRSGGTVSPSPEPASKPPRRYRLWTSLAGGRRSILHLESTDPIGPPCWSLDGRCLFVLRAAAETGRLARIETLQIRGPESIRVVHVEKLDDASELDPAYLDSAPAVSPDGRWLIVPRARSRGLELLDLSNGRVVRSFDNTGLPAWSPDGNRVAMAELSQPAVLTVVEPRNGKMRPIYELGEIDQAPVWSADGGSLLVSSRNPPPRFGDFGRFNGSGLVRVLVDGGQTLPAIGTELEPNRAGIAPITQFSFAIDRRGENLFYSAIRPEVAPRAIWLKNGEAIESIELPFVDESLPPSALAAPSTGRRVSARITVAGELLSPVYYDLESMKLSAFAPDEKARLAWIGLLLKGCRQVVDGARAGRSRLSPFEPASPSPVPTPGEFLESGEELGRMRRMGQLGLSLCREGGAGLDEPALFFAYLAGDFDAATAALERLESTQGDRDRNLLLLGLRASIHLSKAEFDGFVAAVLLLERIESRQGRELIEYADGFRFEPPNKRWARWSDVLRKARVHMERDPEEVEAKPTGHRLGFDF